MPLRAPRQWRVAVGAPQVEKECQRQGLKCLHRTPSASVCQQDQQAASDQAKQAFGGKNTRIQHIGRKPQGQDLARSRRLSHSKQARLQQVCVCIRGVIDTHLIGTLSMKPDLPQSLRQVSPSSLCVVDVAPLQCPRRLERQTVLTKNGVSSSGSTACRTLPQRCSAATTLHRGNCRCRALRSFYFDIRNEVRQAPRCNIDDQQRIRR